MRLTRESRVLFHAICLVALAVTAQDGHAQLLIAADGSPPVSFSAFAKRIVDAHPEIAAARARGLAAEGARRTAGAWTNPVLSYQRERMDTPMPGMGVGNAYETSVVAMLPLSPLYQLGARAGAARADVVRANAELRSTQRDVTLRLVSATYRAANAQVMVDAGADIQRWLDSLIVYTRHRVDEGATAELDLVRLEVEQRRNQTELALARIDAARSLAEVTALSGAKHVSIAIASGQGSMHASAPLPSLDALIATAIRQRPDLAAANAQVASATNTARLEHRSVFRDISAMAGMKSMDGARSLMIGASATLPLFDQNRGEIQRANAERSAATFARDVVERNIIAEVSGLYQAALALEEQAAAFQGGLLTRAEEARRIAEGAYREGAVALVQVLDAARALSEARIVYYRALFAREQTLVELSAAVGADTIVTGENR